MGEATMLDARSRERLPRIVLAALLMGAVLYGGHMLLTPFLADAVWRYAALVALIALGIVSYFAIGALIGAFRLSDFRKLRQR
jgi:putative peptidoglycan lipid II flippase